jgi:hypothetical protein
MNINWFGATLLAAMVAALPAYANDGGKGGGDAAGRLLQQQQQQQEEQQEEEQVPEAATPPPESILDSLEEPAPAPKASNDPGTLAARDFYKKVVDHIDTVLEQQRQKLAGLDRQIAGIDHKLATDFTKARDGDKTTDDAIDSAKQTLDSVPKAKLSSEFLGNMQVDLANTQLADKDLVAASKAIVDFKATAASIKALEAARADMAAAGKAYGAEIK